jgi:hypothetical protein
MKPMAADHIGKTLLFKLRSCGYQIPRGVLRRKIHGIDDRGRPLITFAGYQRDFVVELPEVVGVEA